MLKGIFPGEARLIKIKLIMSSLTKGERLAFKEAKTQLHAEFGMQLSFTKGEKYRVNYRGAREESAYYTADLQDAIRMAKAMCENATRLPQS